MAGDFEQLIHPFFRQEGEAVSLGQGVGLQGLLGCLFHRLLDAVIMVPVSAPLSPQHALVRERSWTC